MQLLVLASVVAVAWGAPLAGEVDEVVVVEQPATPAVDEVVVVEQPAAAAEDAPALVPGAVEPDLQATPTQKAPPADGDLLPPVPPKEDTLFDPLDIKWIHMVSLSADPIDIVIISTGTDAPGTDAPLADTPTALPADSLVKEEVPNQDPAQLLDQPLPSIADVPVEETKRKAPVPEPIADIVIT